MKDSGKTIRQMVMEYIIIQTVHFMKENGRMTNRKEKGLRNG